MSEGASKVDYETLPPWEAGRLSDDVSDYSTHSITVDSSTHSDAGLMNNNKHRRVNAMKPLEISKDEPDPNFHPVSGEKYRYELWEGKNKFLCGGRLMFGVHLNHLMMSLLLMVCTYSVFLLVVVPMLHRPELFLIGVVLSVSNIYFLLATALTDPGIIPRRPPSQLLESMSQDMREKIQYCHTCRIVRPARAKHCKYCDNCVDVFDHHCPWTGTCIGVRNYRYFLLFVSLTVLSAGFACATSSYLIAQWIEGTTESKALSPNMMYVRDTVAPLMSVWTFAVICLVGALLVFHLFLIGRGQTTNEFLRGVPPPRAKSGRMPSFLENNWRVCCRPCPESKLLPMHQRRTTEDAAHDSNAVAHAIDSLRAALEDNFR